MAIYYPVLRWKLGERAALANLTPAVKDQISPIIEFPLDCDYDDRKVTDFCNNASTDWGVGRPFYLDLSTVDFDDAPTGADHPALELFRNANRLGLDLIPIFNVDMDPDLLIAIQDAFTAGLFRYMALRITENEEDSAADNAREIIGELGIDINVVDLIIDLRDVSDGAIRGKIRILNTLVGQFGNEYRSTIVLSGAIPIDLSNYVDTDSSEFINRHDWRIWNQAKRLPHLGHILFGDYTTIPCEFREVPYRGAPKIKYTTENDWFVIKGHLSRQRDNQRQNLAQVVVNDNFFRGSDNSFGENRIQQCADGEWGPGSPTNWVAIDVNQHITFVVSQVSAILGDP